MIKNSENLLHISYKSCCYYTEIKVLEPEFTEIFIFRFSKKEQAEKTGGGSIKNQNMYIIS